VEAIPRWTFLNADRIRAATLYATITTTAGEASTRTTKPTTMSRRFERASPLGHRDRRVQRVVTFRPDMSPNQAET